MSFHQQDFKTRLNGMGDLAERVFEEHYEHKWDRWGFNRAKINMASVPPFVRYAPDYATAKGLVECQGFGKDQTLKVKHHKLDALFEWHRIWRVDLFLFDSAKQRFGWVRLPELDEALRQYATSMRFANDGNTFWALPAAAIPVVNDWIPVGETLRASR